MNIYNCFKIFLFFLFDANNKKMLPSTFLSQYALWSRYWDELLLDLGININTGARENVFLATRMDINLEVGRVYCRLRLKEYMYNDEKKIMNKIENVVREGIVLSRMYDEIDHDQYKEFKEMQGLEVLVSVAFSIAPINAASEISVLEGVTFDYGLVFSVISKKKNHFVVDLMKLYATRKESEKTKVGWNLVEMDFVLKQIKDYIEKTGDNILEEKKKE